jgi:hypothetical protein
MINVMGYVALFSGILIGLAYLSRPKIFDWVIMYVVFYKYRDRKRFYSLFDKLKNKIVTEYIEDHGFVHNYSEYVNIHKELRPSAYDKAMYYFGQVAVMVILRILPICLLPAIIFLSNWYMYMAGILLIVLLKILYILIVEPKKFTMRRDIVVIAIINDFIKDKREKI